MKERVYRYIIWGISPNIWDIFKKKALRHSDPIRGIPPDPTAWFLGTFKYLFVMIRLFTVAKLVFSHFVAEGFFFHLKKYGKPQCFRT